MDVAWTRVGAYVLCRDEPGRLLLTRYAAPGYPDHGKWTMPGGGMEGETAAETALRELREEAGLTATLRGVVGVWSRWFTDEESLRGEAGRLTCIVFEAEDAGGVLHTEFPGDGTTDDARWFTLDEIRDLPRVELVDYVVELIEGGNG